MGRVAGAETTNVRPQPQPGRDPAGGSSQPPRNSGSHPDGSGSQRPPNEAHIPPPPSISTIEILNNKQGGSEGARLSSTSDGSPSSSGSGVASIPASKLQKKPIAGLPEKVRPDGLRELEDGTLYAEISGARDAILVRYDQDGKLRAMLEGDTETSGPTGPVVTRLNFSTNKFRIISGSAKQPENNGMPTQRVKDEAHNNTPPQENNLPHLSSDGGKQLSKDDITKYSNFLGVSEQKLKELDRSLATLGDESRSAEVAKDAVRKFLTTGTSHLSGMAVGAVIGSMLTPGIGTALGITAGLATGAITKKATQYAMKKFMESINVNHPSYPKTKEAQADIENSMKSLIDQYVTPYLKTPEAFVRTAPEFVSKQLIGLFTDTSVPLGDMVGNIESLTKGSKLSIEKSLKIIGLASRVRGTMNSLHDNAITSLVNISGDKEIQATGIINTITRKKIDKESIGNQMAEVNRRIDNVLRQILDPDKYKSPGDAEVVRDYMLKITGKSLQQV
ncbi:hypothetical protein ACVHYJ_17605 [Burkholderia pyrrocinia]